MKSKHALDKIVKKSRVHLYKPIQIAEILFHHRTIGDINPGDLATFRNVSKKWRDDVSRRLVGNVSTSSQKFQDNVFEDNAMPPNLLEELADYNKRKGGIVENYVYHRLKERLEQLIHAFEYLNKADIKSFKIEAFLKSFTQESGLKRSIDKVYEITVYALFSTIVRALNVQVKLCIGNLDKEMMQDFNRFLELVVGLSKDIPEKNTPARLFRVGVANAADRGLDMWTNFGPAIQVKHVSLSEELAEDVADSIMADNIVFVCLDAEAKMIERIMTQLAFGKKIQGIITLSDLINWYDVCLSGKYRDKLGKTLLSDLKREFGFEFPICSEIDAFINERGYSQAALVDDWAL